ncbi:MAG TPA: AraC family transcriptional regulator [Niastella sp.]
MKHFHSSGKGKASINTYNTEMFRQRFIQQGQKSDTIMKPGFAKFFIVKVEDMIRMIKLPVPPVRTTSHTLIFLTDGEAIMTIGSETWKIVKNECLVVPAGQVFSFDHVDINKGYLCNFHNDFIAGRFGKKDLFKHFEFLNAWGNHRISTDDPIAGYIQHLFQRIYLDYSQNGLQHLNIIHSNLIALLCELENVYQPFSDSKHTKAVTLTNRFKELLFANIKTKQLVSDYASLLHITPNHLNKAVKQITGKSPSRWINEMLVVEAKMLLNQTNLSINEVAGEIGIFDASYFSRLFKKYEGVTPLAFRKMIEKS